MKFSVNTVEMNEAIATVIKAMPAHSSISILEGIYIEGFGDRLFMKCSDLSMQIETEIPADVEIEGKCVLPGRLAADLLKRFNGDTVFFETEDDKKDGTGTLRLISGRVRSKLQTRSADDYPEMARVNKEFTAVIPRSAFRSMIKQTLFSASADDDRPILNGACLKFDGNTLTMVTLDGFRIAMRTEPLREATGTLSVVIPARAMQEIYNFLAVGDDDITIILSSTHVKIEIGSTRLISRLIDGEFVSYAGILPKTFNSRVLLNCKELRESIERAALMAKEDNSTLVKLKFSENGLHVTANSEMGDVDEEFPIQLIGKDITIAFNSKYLLDVLRAVDVENIYMNMGNPISPCVFVPPEGDEFYYLVLPVRIPAEPAQA